MVAMMGRLTSWDLISGGLFKLLPKSDLEPVAASRLLYEGMKAKACALTNLGLLIDQETANFWHS